MDDYVPKPVSANMLLAAINTLVPDDRAPSETCGGRRRPRNKRNTEEPIIDKATLLKAFDDDWDFFTEVVEMFIQDYPPMMSDIAAALQAQDAPTLMRSGHALKGMLGNFQATTGMQLAYRLEEIGTPGGSSIMPMQTYQKLSDELTKLASIFKKIVKEEAP